MDGYVKSRVRPDRVAPASPASTPFVPTTLPNLVATGGAGLLYCFAVTP